MQWQLKQYHAEASPTGVHPAGLRAPQAAAAAPAKEPGSIQAMASGLGAGTTIAMGAGSAVATLAYPGVWRWFPSKTILPAAGSEWCQNGISRHWSMEQGRFKQAQKQHSSQSCRPAVLPQVTVNIY